MTAAMNLMKVFELRQDEDLDFHELEKLTGGLNRNTISSALSYLLAGSAKNCPKWWKIEKVRRGTYRYNSDRPQPNSTIQLRVGDPVRLLIVKDDASVDHPVDYRISEFNPATNNLSLTPDISWQRLLKGEG